MSDEVRMIRAGVQAARDRRTVPSFNDDIGDAIERDALAALARLESQNQALQERIEEAMKIDDETVSTSSHYCIGWQDAVRAMKRALSPTQETDRA